MTTMTMTKDRAAETGMDMEMETAAVPVDLTASQL
jgi:hypothetical protein